MAADITYTYPLRTKQVRRKQTTDSASGLIQGATEALYDAKSRLRLYSQEYATSQKELLATHTAATRSFSADARWKSNGNSAQYQGREDKTWQVQATPELSADDINKILDETETAPRKDEYKEAPGELKELLSSLCTKHAVGCPVWAQSLKDWRHISVYGRGVTRIQEEELVFPGFTFTTIESGPLHTKQCCSRTLKVIQKEADCYSAEWVEVNGTATWELVLVGRERNKDTPLPDGEALFVVGPAHFILSHDQCERLVAEQNPTSIEEMRKEMNSLGGDVRYVLVLNVDDDDADDNNTDRPRLDLKQQPMLAYRHYYNNVGVRTVDEQNLTCHEGRCITVPPIDECPHTFMNDIALIPFEHHIANQFRQQIQANRERCHGIQFNQIISLENDHIERIIEERRVIYVGEVECCLVPTPAPVPTNAERIYAEHIAFDTTNDGIQLREGYSGSILYLRRRNDKLAFGMAIGEIGDRYQAILLKHALRDIEIDYRHHVEQLRPLVL